MGRVIELDGICSDYQRAQIYLGGLAGNRVDHKRPGRITAANILGKGLMSDWEMASASIKKFSAYEEVGPWADRILADSWKCILRLKPFHDRLVKDLLALVPSAMPPARRCLMSTRIH